MFENLSDKLSSTLSNLKKKGTLSDSDVKTALREIRVALLEADVALSVVREFTEDLQQKATGQIITKSVTPGQQVVKLVQDELVKILSDPDDSGNLKIDNPPAPVLMVGLQGSGKTTTTAKIAKRLKERDAKKVLMASLDTNRPAAMEQLAILGEQIQVDTLPIIKAEDPIVIAKRAKLQASTGGYDVYILDTAGRLHIDDDLIKQAAAIRDVVLPRETLLVVDGLSGQDAVNVATEFNDKIGISGVVLTRMDGDGRGGAALSMRAITGKPIRFMGTGEKLNSIEKFDPNQIANRILGLGDVVALVEKAQESMNAEDTARAIKRISKGQFNLNDYREQLIGFSKMSDSKGIFALLPNFKRIANQIHQDTFKTQFAKQIAIIDSMTKKERAFPQILQASRKKRIAAGSGTTVNEINKLIKVHRQMSTQLKKFSSNKMGQSLLKKMMVNENDDYSENANETVAQLEDLVKQANLFIPNAAGGNRLGQFRGFKKGK
ncbi:MAG: signal recognition particle protein [Aestuariivita sp.]|nr:signal recognition particle protein [Aestuariivita sp.]